MQNFRYTFFIFGFLIHISPPVQNINAKQHFINTNFQGVQYIKITNLDNNVDLDIFIANGHDTVVERAIEWINSTSTGVADKPEIPNEYFLSNNYPYPFNPSTTIQYKIPKPSHVKFIVRNSLRQIVKTLVDEFQDEGYISIERNGLDNQNEQAISGVYFHRLSVRNSSEVKTMILMQ